MSEITFWSLIAGIGSLFGLAFWGLYIEVLRQRRHDWRRPLENSRREKR